jgi:predicted flap endonuclease-1-like 5' DNA nuclease
MLQIVETHWLAFALALVIGLLVAWWLFGRGGGKRRERYRTPDALDEGAAPAARNQALIDAPPAVIVASFADTGPDILAGIGEVVAMGAAREVAAARKAADQSLDDLSRIKGVGPKLVTLLGQLGVTRFAQIAAWSEEDIDRIDAQLGTFAGRIRRDGWVEQCKMLSAGDTAGFEAKFGKL